MITLFKKLGITPSKDKPFICTIGSQCGVGKTTVLLTIASELVSGGKNVLFVSDDSPSHLIKRLNMGNTIPNGKLIFKQYIPDTSLDKIIKETNFDYAIVDSVYSEVLEKNSIIDLLISKNICTFVSSQLRRSFEDVDIFDLKPSVKLLHKSDYMISLNKTKFTWFERFKNWLFNRKPNVKLAVLKNRYGKDGVSTSATIDFKNLIIA